MSQIDDDMDLDSALLAALARGLKPVAPPPALRTRILDCVRATTAGTGTLMTVRGGESGWRTLIPGIDFKMLIYDEAGGTKSFLLRALAGMRMPPHAHNGPEECLVLEGAFSFGDLTLRAGDFHYAAPDGGHGESHTETGVTVYLRSSILDYPGIVP